MDENGWLVEDRRGITWARGTLLARERRALVQQRGLQHLHAARGGDVPVTILPEVPLHSRQPPWRHRISPWGRVRSSAAVPEVAGRCCGASRGNRPARRPVPGYATVPPPSPSASRAQASAAEAPSRCSMTEDSRQRTADGHPPALVERIAGWVYGLHCSGSATTALMGAAASPAGSGSRWCRSRRCYGRTAATRRCGPR